MFLSFLVVPFIFGPVSPRLHPVPILQVILPVALIPRPIHMLINPIAVRLIIKPLPLEHISIKMPEFSFATCLIVFPLAFMIKIEKLYILFILLINSLLIFLKKGYLSITFIFCSIGPGLCAKPISEITSPFPFVNCPTFKLVWRPFFFFFRFRHFFFTWQ